MNLTSKRVRSFAVLGVALLALVIAVLVSRGGGDSKPVAASVTSTARSTSAAVPARGPAATTAPATNRAPGVPDRAYVTLVEIDAGRWPDSANAPGTKGGDTWMNRAGTLAAKDSAGKPITYQEWDVNPKQRNRSRDAERIVTGSDGSAWYTGDHYETFTRMR
ncbi:ribonuclease [Nocardia sp. NBC_00565]|uniref:ribonuclease domain-containing protein n=1 Tax=Nocardia sp. NBC_00565 TaxID=2975993 RepID=UPI002E8223A2|nr:ribonuclease domain-containing protein [Nocardia sp. NBC_00565]WUC03010.1 ribonuclease [Nocardia sp. NBC_00565]